MASTIARSCTGSVPESITSGSAAGQGLMDQRGSRFPQNCTCGNDGQRNGGRQRADQPVQGAWRVTTGHREASRFVPDLYPRRSLGQRLTDTLIGYTVALVFLPFTLWLDREDRKAVR